ncbi:MAG: hypothetical protein ACE5DM_04035 [Candidatus Nanoarchaeia archaeon]
MKCARCDKEATCKYVDKQVCERCLTDLVEKAVRKQLRTAGIKKGDKILVIGESSKWFVKNILTVPCEIQYEDRITKETADHTILPITTDDIGKNLLESFFNDQDMKKMKGIALFARVTDDALAAFCKIKRIKYKRESCEEKDLVDSLERQYPGTKNALAQSAQSL